MIVKQPHSAGAQGPGFARPFRCKACGRQVDPAGAGSRHRNHCPYCLSSLHLDSTPGDRASGCGGLMDPIAVWVRRDGEWAVIHRCRRCGALSSNRTAADDNPAKLLGIAAGPLARPPFPLEHLEAMMGETAEPGSDNG
ncbi:MAG: RNHCP domain-containing protein [Oscillibacter sp.]|nr:RNHCP domain-containing protein [Oscillibacter sp.]